jgi:hypothetical protein
MKHIIELFSEKVQAIVDLIILMVENLIDDGLIDAKTEVLSQILIK